ncbi:MAG: FABP family protein [Nocardioides sp.]|uniref:FABP family protein n=1 Tax=Nocardioides sp. TaxID=35761 RepID=UPI0039E30185
MAFQIPDDLSPAAGPVAWLLGTWRGNGHGDYPTIEPFQFGQELIFTHDGRPFFHYMSRSWVIDAETGEKIREDVIETGFLRCLPGEAPGQASLELVLTQSTGLIEVWYGAAADGKIELHTAGVAHTETGPDVTAGKRLYGNVEGDLLYAYDMEAEGQEMQPHRWARLQRA